MNEVIEKTPAELIIKHLEDNGQRLSWLAEKAGISRSHLYFVLYGNEETKRNLTEDNRRKINEILKTNY